MSISSPEQPNNLDINEVRKLLYAFDGHGSEAIQHAKKMLSSADPSIIGAILKDLLRDADPVIKVSAADTLIEMEIPDITDVMLPLLQDPDSMVRTYISGFLRYGDSSSIDMLISLVQNDPDPHVRFTCITTLEEIGDSRALPALRNAYINDPDTDYQGHSISAAALRAIHVIEQRQS